MPGPTARLLSLLSLLQTPRTWAGSELADRLDVTQRTVRRDVDRLRELGYPVESDLGTHGGYRLVAGTAMPPLLFEDDEAVAAAIGLRAIAVQGIPELEDAGVRALAKLSRSLPARLRHRVRVLGASTMTWRAPVAGHVDPDVLTALAAAAANRERVRMEYTRRDGTRGPRHVEPCKLVSTRTRWYLVAFDVDRQAWRTFRADRIHQPRPTGSAARHHLADPEIYTQLQESESALAATYRADVTLHLPLATARERLRDHLGDGELTADAGGTRWHSAEDTAEWLAIRLLLLDCHFTVHGPPVLREYLASIHERTAVRPNRSDR
ncbi:helix-turn-helix transcriptional regulator [Nocardia stercoris]|uniref:YafY family transcriptional regulator n=1 Tax=Nocardia stercoris TaxID=2483361 RepID=A0A3M2LDJ1_9NOCA|nr:YafY family protein [Nocardia stercoris]RMI34830.1 YafY family transcriptional regulator [Nocardia stercoris]